MTEVTLYDRISKINTESIEGRTKHIQNGRDNNIYTDGSKTKLGVGAGFTKYHKHSGAANTESYLSYDINLRVDPCFEHIEVKILTKATSSQIF